MNSSDDLVSRIRQIAERAQQRPRPSAPKPPPKPARVVRLPIWPAELRTCPSCVLRSALFGVVRRGRRQYLQNQIVAAWADTTLRYTGIRLDQADLDVWLHRVAPLPRTGTRGASGLFGTRLFAGVGSSTQKRGMAENLLERLTACVVKITRQRRTYWGSLIEKGCPRRRNRRVRHRAESGVGRAV